MTGASDRVYTVTISVEAGGVIMRLAGELDLAAKPAFTAAVDGVWTDGRTAAIIVDLAEATFIDSSMIGALVAAWKTAGEQGRRLTVINAQGMVYRVLHTAGVLDVLGDAPRKT